MPPTPHSRPLDGGPVFSNRLDWSPSANRLSVAVADRRRSGLPVIDLTVANPTRAGLCGPAVSVPCPVTYEPDPFGNSDVREVVAAYYAESHGAQVDPADIMLAPSTSDAYSWLFRLLCDPGDEVIVPRPSYPLFDYLAALDGVRAVTCHQLCDGGWWHLDCEALAAQCREGTRAIVVVSPNNPTGAFLKKAELASLAVICERQNLALIVDEVFADYAWRVDDDRAGSLAGCRDIPSFVLSGLSKICGLPQEKLSWIVVAGPAAFRQRARNALALIGDAYLSVAGRVQAAAPQLLADRLPFQRALLQRVAANRLALADALSGTSVSILPAEGGWSTILKMPQTRTDEEWALHLLATSGLLVHPGYLFDFVQPSCLVVSLLPPAMPAARLWQAALD